MVGICPMTKSSCPKVKPAKLTVVKKVTDLHLHLMAKQAKLLGTKASMVKMTDLTVKAKAPSEGKQWAGDQASNGLDLRRIDDVAVGT